MASSRTRWCAWGARWRVERRAARASRWLRARRRSRAHRRRRRPRVHQPGVLLGSRPPARARRAHDPRLDARGRALPRNRAGRLRAGGLRRRDGRLPRRCVRARGLPRPRAGTRAGTRDRRGTRQRFLDGGALAAAHSGRPEAVRAPRLRRRPLHLPADGTRPQLRFAPVSNSQEIPALRSASYEADPAEVHRVLLLYSGGLDTSVMLKWIQDSYGAEVVCLTVNLGQPGEDYEVIRAKAMQLGALECHIIDAREEFAREYVLPAIKANAQYGGGYPLFTALGRPLIAKLAVEQARESGCDTIAHGCTGKGNDQVRIEATIATLAPELKVIAPVRSWQMGREEEIAYAREHGIPVKSSQGTESGAPYSIDDNLWGRSSEGRWIEDLEHAPDDDVFQLVTRPELAPEQAQT